MPEMVEIDRTQLALILDALGDATFYRDGLDHALDRLKGRHARASTDERIHRVKAKQYSDLAAKLKKEYG